MGKEKEMNALRAYDLHSKTRSHVRELKPSRLTTHFYPQRFLQKGSVLEVEPTTRVSGLPAIFVMMPGFSEAVASTIAT